MLDGCAAPKTLLLKEGAQVVLLKNLDPLKKLVNGSCGVVVGFRASRVRAECASAPWEEPILPPGQTGGARSTVYPLVRFGATGEARVIVPEQWTIESGGRQAALSRP